MKFGKTMIACAATALVSTTMTAVALRQDGAQDMEEMMKKWMEMCAPDEHHAELAKAAGNWTMTSKMWMYPGAEPETSTSQSTMKSILDGRYLMETVKGEMAMGETPMPFEGINIIGYDTIKKKWVNCWVDNFTTGFMVGEGTESADGKTITYWAEVPDPMTGGMKKMKYETINQGPDKMIFRMYDKSQDGVEFVHMEGVYTRNK